MPETAFRHHSVPFVSNKFLGRFAAQESGRVREGRGLTRSLELENQRQGALSRLSACPQDTEAHGSGQEPCRYGRSWEQAWRTRRRVDRRASWQLQGKGLGPGPGKDDGRRRSASVRSAEPLCRGDPGVGSPELMALVWSPRASTEAGRGVRGSPCAAAVQWLVPACGLQPRILGLAGIF